MQGENPGMLSAVTETIARASDLIQLEFRVFRAELTEKAAQLRTGLAFVLAGAVLLTAALFLLLQALVYTLVQSGLSPAAATLLVGAICIAIGGALVMTGRKKFEAEHLAPDRTLEDLQRSSTLVKEKLT